MLDIKCRSHYDLQLLFHKFFRVGEYLTSKEALKPSLMLVQYDVSGMVIQSVPEYIFLFQDMFGGLRIEKSDKIMS
jgi:hypothetical protein